MKLLFPKLLWTILLLAPLFLLTTCKEKEAPPKPVAFFTYTPTTNLVAPVTIYFTNDSKNATSYRWETSDGQTSTAEAVTLTIRSGSSITMTLTATGAGGSATYSRTITVAAPVTPPPPNQPTAGFTYSPSTNLVAPAPVTFTNTSTNATSYKWDFGDGTTSTTASPTKTFTADGTYSVKLTATNASSSNETSRSLVVAKAATVEPYGRAIFWATGSWDYVDVTTEEVFYRRQVGETGLVSFGGGRIGTLFTSAPACGATGAYNTERPARAYTYKAIAYKSGSIKVAEVSGNYTVVANACTAIKLDFPAAATGQAVFWTDQSSGWSSIDVTVGGTAAGSITGYSSSAPACGSSKVVTVTRAPGTYAYTARSNTGVTWSDNITITTNQCNAQKLPFPAVASCDFTEWAKYLKQTKYEFDAKNGCTPGWTQVWIQNTSNTDFAIRLCIQGPDGKWSCGLDKTLSGKEYKDWTCGKALGYKVWAMPASKSFVWGDGSCAFPKFP